MNKELENEIKKRLIDFRPFLSGYDYDLNVTEHEPDSFSFDSKEPTYVFKYHVEVVKKPTLDFRAFGSSHRYDRKGGYIASDPIDIPSYVRSSMGPGDIYGVSCKNDIERCVYHLQSILDDMEKFEEDG